MIQVIEAPKSVVFSRADTWVELFAGSAPGVPYTTEDKPLNYLVEVEFQFEYVYNSGTFVSVVTLPQFVNALGSIKINIMELLHSEFMKSFTEPPLPTIGSTAAYICDNIRKYKLRAREISGTDYAEGTWLDIGSNLRTIFGGISVDKSIELWDATSLDQAQSMFTWMPDKMMVGVGQPYYITVHGGGSIVANLIGLSNNTIQSVTINDPGTGDGQSATYYIGTKLFTDANVSNGYKVTLEFQNGENKSYYIDHYREGKSDLMFINGFGAPECIRMRGEVDETMKITREKSETIRRRDTPISIGDVKQYAGTWDDGFTFRTGYISEGECRALKEMLAYNILFRIRGSVYEALDITSDEVAINSTGQFLKTIEFEAVRAVKKKIMPTL